MKLKNLLCLILATLMMFSVISVSAAEEDAIELFTNGGCETLGAVSWDAGSNEGCGLSTDYARTGSYSYRMYEGTGAARGPEGVAYFNAFEGATYTFSGWVYIEKKVADDSQPGITMLFMDQTKNDLARADMEITGGKEGKWYEVKVSGVAPAGVSSVELHTRVYNGGVYYWDDCSLKVTGNDKIMTAYRENLALEEKLLAEATADYEEELSEVFATEMIEGTNLLKNVSFEEGEGNAAKNWTGYQNQWGPVTSRTDEEARSGNYSMKVDTRGNSRAANGPYANQQIQIEDGLIPGQKYVFSAWVKVKESVPGGGAAIKIEPFSAREATLESFLPEATTEKYTWIDEDPNGENWHLLRTTIEVDEETKMMTFLLRLRGEGVVYYDDISFGLADGGTRFEMYTTRVFNYIEHGTGTAVAEFNTAGFAIEPNSTVEFVLKDGDTVLDSGVLPAAQKVMWNFDIKKLPKELVPYTIEATYKDVNGNPIGNSIIKRVYKTHRPQKLDKNGNYIDTNGEYFFPVIAYGNGDDYWKESEVHGINVFHSLIARSSIRDVDKAMNDFKKMLDDAQKEGVKFCIQFGGGEPNGYPGAATDLMEKFLDKCANHPAIFAYLLVDEASLKINSTSKIKTYDYMEYWLEQGYIQIRSKDSVNPIYLLDVGAKSLMERSSRIADIFATDPYPREETAVPGYTYIRTRWSTTGNNFQTPVAIITQMTPYEGSYRPTATAIRHQYYQAFWGGAKMLGFFSLTGARDMTLEAIKDIPERYEELCQFYQTGEQQIAFEHFTTPNTTLIANWQENDIWYRVWRDKKGRNYLLILNNEAKETEATGKLVSNNGKLSVDGYTATLINGTGMPETLSSPDNTFTVKMPSIGVGLYELKPNSPLDLSKLTDDAYADIAGYDWAEKEIETLAMRDVVNEIAGGFAPGENITRADFAGFLIRALGLEADASSTFDDIDPNHYYAKEIAMGKALGILTGVGNNLYNPNEAISRQDVMTICSRGMEIAKTLDTTGSLVRLNSFTDKDLFADYAALHASKMVIEGIVKGNPDQTINPLGNTTRAEAAVMMYRIIYKGQAKMKA